MSKIQWTLFTFTGIIFIVSVNIWAAKRDAILFQTQEDAPVIYKQLPVIPFTN